MLAIAFPGSSTLIRTLDDAVACGTLPALTDNLRHGLCHVMRGHDVTLPACVHEPVDGHYARRQLYASEHFGYVVIAMTWGPGQGTPIHDHNGMWCVEAVWQGDLEITQYELAARDADRYRFRAVGSIQAGTGSAGSLIPPHEHHAILNPSRDEVCVSLHVYSGAMTRCAVFTPLADDWYRCEEHQLGLDRVA